MRATETAWAAGFFDGEGNVRVQPYTGRNNMALRLEVHQCDRPILERFQRAVGGCGAIYDGTNARYNPKWSPSWRFCIWNAADVKRVTTRLLPYLSPVKSEQVRKAIVAYDAFYAQRQHGRWPKTA